MRAQKLARQTLTIMCLLALGIGLLAAPASHAQNQPAAPDARAPVPLRLTLDHPIDGAAAPFVLAASKGYFRTAGLNMTINAGNGSDDAIARVADGRSDIALADLNALIRFRDAANAPAIKAVFVLFNSASYAIVARKSRGIDKLSDMAGKTLGVAAGDLAIRMWPAVAERNGIKLAAVKQQGIGAAVREPMLAAGQVDAVTGFSYLSAVNLRDRGIPADDLAVLRFADYGSEAYGGALIVNPKFAAEQPDAVRSFIVAVIAGLRLTLKEPAQAVDAVVAEMNGGSRDLERERLRTLIHTGIVTDEVKRNGFGAIDEARFNVALDQIAVDFKFRNRPSVSDIFDATFLPPLDQRQLR